MPESLDVHVQIGRQLGLFLRRFERMHAELKVTSDGVNLERAAYGLLGHIVTDGPARLSALADVACVDLSAVSRQVAALESAGLVARTTDLSDRRASVITATDTGQEVYTRNRKVWLAALEELLADWSPEERLEFARLFARLNTALGTRGVKQEKI